MALSALINAAAAQIGKPHPAEEIHYIERFRGSSLGDFRESSYPGAPSKALYLLKMNMAQFLPNEKCNVRP